MDFFNRKKLDLLNGPILKNLFYLGLPIIITNLLQTAYNLADTFWVGRLGAEAVAAISIVFPIVFLLIAAAGGLGLAGTVLVAQYTGKKDKEKANFYAGQTFSLVLIVCAVVSIIGIIGAPALVRLMGAPPEVFPLAVSYIKIILAGLVFMFGSFIFAALLNGFGDTITPMKLLGASVLLNIVLDPIFIFGWGPIPAFGVKGAAIATVIARGVGAVIGVVMLFSKKYGVHLTLENLKPKMSTFREICRIGVPSSMEQTVRALGITMLVTLVAGLGTTALAAYGIGIRVMGLALLPALGFGMATATMVGQNIGAGKKDRAETITWMGAKASFAVLLGVGILTFVFAEPITAIFIKGAPEVVAEGTLFLKVISFSFCFMGAGITIGGAFKGAGCTGTALVLALINSWFARIPLAYLLAYTFAMGTLGLWLSLPISTFIAVMISLLWFRQGTWRRKKVTKDAKIISKVVEEEIAEEGVVA